MADPICRWRNPYLKTVRELIALLPKKQMPALDARRIINEKFDDDFFHTAYQLACQLGLYYEDGDNYYPRFDYDPSVEELLKYLRGWIRAYYVPNPYTKRGFQDVQPTILHSSLCELLIKAGTSVAWNEAKLSHFKEEIGNDDILRNTINNYSEVIEIVGNRLKIKEGIEYADLNGYVYTLDGIERESKKDFFRHFNNLHAPQIQSFDNGVTLVESFLSYCEFSGLKFQRTLVSRFIASLLTKPFVILTGLSGSGKTKLAQAFVQWICPDKSHYRIVPVGADWTNREPLLGYPNALDPLGYVSPDSDALSLIISAMENSEYPHFLVLDEMNLSHVERYFADILSVMESKEEMSLYSGTKEIIGIPGKLRIPSNFFIIGTVNIDETTNMFSPKVLDRANTIEFRISLNEMNVFLGKIKTISMDHLVGKGSIFAKDFLELAKNKAFPYDDLETIHATLIKFFDGLRKIGAEFGYRTVTEMLLLINYLSVLDPQLTTQGKVDIAIVQKLLPKLHGSRRKLCPVIEKLGSLCVDDKLNIVNEVFGKTDYNFEDPSLPYPLTLEKLARMHNGAVENGFTSFAEA